MSDAAVRAQALERLHESLRQCTRCDLAEGRLNVVVGTGDPDADLMFVGEAPGATEDETGVPFVGRAGQLLDSLLEDIGLSRDRVFIANVLKCRPPGNRDPRPGEIEACQGYLAEQVSLVRPRLVCSLGNFATKLISGSPDGISTVHGRVQEVSFAGVSFTLYPVFHPAAALYTRAMLGTLQEDFARIPGLIGTAAPAPAQGAAAPADDASAQMGLF